MSVDRQERKGKVVRLTSQLWKVSGGRMTDWREAERM